MLFMKNPSSHTLAVLAVLAVLCLVLSVWPLLPQHKVSRVSSQIARCRPARSSARFRLPGV